MWVFRYNTLKVLFTYLNYGQALTLHQTGPMWVFRYNTLKVLFTYLNYGLSPGFLSKLQNQSFHTPNKIVRATSLTLSKGGFLVL
jgi:hypothetical protein